MKKSSFIIIIVMTIVIALVITINTITIANLKNEIKDIKAVNTDLQERQIYLEECIEYFLTVDIADRLERAEYDIAVNGDEILNILSELISIYDKLENK
jgi:hypothetical protein